MLAVRQGLDVGPCTPFIEALLQRIAVIDAVGQKVWPSTENVARAAPIVRLAFGQLQSDRPGRPFTPLRACCSSAAARGKPEC
jgi:hypothetical protein